ncbi:MAG: class I SAM-dependent methyltransferase [Gemmatimonadota bacterium]|jgi:SAM-dependent methyltransferase
MRDDRTAPDTRAFYDALADDYHHVYADWERSIGRQAGALDALIATRLGPGPHRILDCTCGIGTQSLGLAALGHAVTGTDLSAAAIARARRESVRRSLEIAWDVADVRTLPDRFESAFDVVFSGDNSLPHLLTQPDLERAAHSMITALRPGGLLLASIRDYDALLERKPPGTSPAFAGPPGERRITFQLWEWEADGRTYTLEMFVLKEGPPETWTVRTHRTRYRAITRAQLGATLAAAGIEDPTWIMPGDSGFFQPVVLGERVA